MVEIGFETVKLLFKIVTSAMNNASNCFADNRKKKLTTKFSGTDDLRDLTGWPVQRK